jgi:hypothetical protein
MKKAYISSFYQAANLKEGYKPNSNKDSHFSESSQSFDILLERIFINGVMQISEANFRDLSDIYDKSINQPEYLVAVYCDMEVAIQEKKLSNMAEKFGFEVVLLNDNSSKLYYLEEFSVDAVILEDEEIIANSVFIINTHGKVQSIDGPYQQAIYHQNNVSRILIDACSSAASCFPIKNSGKVSLIS